MHITETKSMYQKDAYMLLCFIVFTSWQLHHDLMLNPKFTLLALSDWIKSHITSEYKKFDARVVIISSLRSEILYIGNYEVLENIKRKKFLLSVIFPNLKQNTLDNLSCITTAFS